MSGIATPNKTIDRAKAEALRIYDLLEQLKTGATELQAKLLTIGTPSEYGSLRETVDRFLLGRTGEFQIEELRAFVEANYPLAVGSSLNTTLNRAIAQGKVAKVPPNRSGRWMILEAWKDQMNT